MSKSTAASTRVNEQTPPNSPRDNYLNDKSSDSKTSEIASNLDSEQIERPEGNPSPDAQPPTVLSH
jgi:hypothetical protein